MKIMIATDGSTLESKVAERFARANYFLIYDDQTDSIVSLENNDDSSHGAGPQAVQIAINNGVEIIFSAIPGENAIKAIKSSNIKVYDGRGYTAKEAIAAYKENKIKLL